MPAKAQLKEIIDALEMQMDEYSSYFDRETGKVETVSHDLLSKAEDSSDGEEPDELLEWQTAEWEVAKRIVSTGHFQQLPTKFDMHEWSIMQDFSLSLEPGRLRDDLLHAIHGRGAFRHFKDTLGRHGVDSAWYAFRAEALKQIAIDWCEEHQIVWD